MKSFRACVLCEAKLGDIFLPSIRVLMANLLRDECSRGRNSYPAITGLMRDLSLSRIFGNIVRYDIQNGVRAPARAHTRMIEGPARAGARARARERLENIICSTKSVEIISRAAFANKTLVHGELGVARLHGNIHRGKRKSRRKLLLRITSKNKPIEG